LKSLKISFLDSYRKTNLIRDVFIYFCLNIVSLKIAQHIPKLYLSIVFY